MSAAVLGALVIPSAAPTAVLGAFVIPSGARDLGASEDGDPSLRSG
jgi:hypothetical protein